MDDQIVYHVTSEQGIKTFYPKPYWHTHDFLHSGILNGDTKIPDGAVRSDLFFAMGKDMVWFWFSPKNVAKTISEEGERNIVFDIRDKDCLAGHSFSIYGLDKRFFRRVSSSEYVSETPVSPVWEVRMSNVIETSRACGVDVVFVDDFRGYVSDRAAGKGVTQRVIMHLRRTADKKTGDAQLTSWGLQC